MYNSHEPDLMWQEMTPEDEIEGGPEIYYFTDEDGKPRYFVPEVNSSVIHLQSIVNDFIKAGADFLI